MVLKILGELIMAKMMLAFLLLLSSATVVADSHAADQALYSTQAVNELIMQLGLKESQMPARELPGWNKPEKVVAWVDKPERLTGLQAAAPGVEIVLVESQEQAITEATNAQVIMGYCSEELLSQAPELHWVQVYSSGVDRCVPNPSLHKGNKLLTNGQRIGSPALAEHSIALMMALVRGLDVYHANQLQGTWQRNTGMEREDFMELEGRTVLVVGLGGIGTQTAKRAHGLGMRVIATRGSRREGPDYVEYVGLADEVNELAARADVVINTAPLTDRTRGMFDAAFFAARPHWNRARSPVPDSM
jgi:phosphoglycerate dehydrogenase-like enzyme